MWATRDYLLSPASGMLGILFFGGGFGIGS